MATSKEHIKQAERLYTKEQLVESTKYMRYADFLSGNLQDGKMYTFEQVDNLIHKYYGKGKSE